MDNFKDFVSLIKNAKNALIISHVNPDGDTLGSMLALSEVLKLNFSLSADMLVLIYQYFVLKFLYVYV